MDQDATCYGSIGLSPGHIVRFGPSSPSKQKGHSPPIFGPYLLWPNGWIDQDATWYEGRRRPGDIVLDGTQLPPKRGTSPQFSAHACRGQMAGLIKMALGTEVGVGPGDIVLDGDPAPPKKWHSPLPPLFGPCLLWSNGWMDQDATWYGGRH